MKRNLMRKHIGELISTKANGLFPLMERRAWDCEAVLASAELSLEDKVFVRFSAASAIY